MSNRKAEQFLDQTASHLMAIETQIAMINGKLVDQDIAARRLEADAGREFAYRVDEIAAALEESACKVNVDQWCKKTIGVDISTMRRRKRLARHWDEYEVKRRELGQCGQSGLLFALSLVQERISQPERTGEPASVRSEAATTSAKSLPVEPIVPNSQFITGDALAELPRLSARSVNTIITSPPYWPAKRAYGGKGIGFEDTLDEYISNLVAVFREAKRVLRDDGVMWIVIDDSYASAGGKWTTEGYHAQRPNRHKSVTSPGLKYPDSTYVRPDGNLLLIPTRLAMALQDDGWICRAEIIWYKGPGGGRPESVTNRVTKNHEKIFMFTKRRQYFYDPDPIREPSAVESTNRAFQAYQNPMGRNSGSVWEITPSSYRGDHPATMPLELVRRMLLVSCPDKGTVMDVFGGAGTTALVALQLGYRAISIEINEPYTKEAQQRIAFQIGASTPNKMAAD